MRIQITVGKVMTEKRRQKNESQTKEADVGSAIEFSESDVTRWRHAPQEGKPGQEGVGLSY